MLLFFLDRTGKIFHALGFKNQMLLTREVFSSYYRYEPVMSLHRCQTLFFNGSACLSGS
ncbi:hypothetical protein QJS10_CPB21g01273 [Acorus calamus]|uniref:Uncharacterized protein n=1 Tax=Acorus calamus TaxID=4465 RepID=A0AAV9C7F4_ACOCL|nr:hypothetical protein QJS10_CPB21g01273 [Acorus calamus]